ncbi:MAG TPA: D-alanine--D-alanine ligase family protein [Ktedonobacterales bacterium]|nr:D-alanine--D-alanine ligase family protein [Ktedonobacterales bacterium]
MKQGKIRVGVVFGSRSVEHEVSVITGQQVIAALDKTRYEVVPIYITKAGTWYTGDKLMDVANFKDDKAVLVGCDPVSLSPDPTVGGLTVRREDKGGLFKRAREPEVLPLDVLFPTIHGTYGEDGTLQGLFELAGIPYVGSGVLGSAVGMDKILMKAVFRDYGLPVVKQHATNRRAWKNAPDETMNAIEQSLGYPVFVKPANLGSSVGISQAKDREELKEALELAAHYDRRLLIEAAVQNAIEINCAVLGFEEPQASVCEQPIPSKDILSYEDKYMRGGKSSGMQGLARIIPAPISDELTKRVQQIAIQSFKMLDCRGVARIDFLLDPKTETLYINEINTLPGSISFYLWEPTGINFSALVDKLIQLAFEAHQERQRTTYSVDSPLLERMGAAGSKTAPSKAPAATPSAT